MLAVLITALANAQGTKDCSQLFITEIIANPTVTPSGFKNNYAVEIFNPTTASISLSGYSFKLTKASGAFITMPLYGTITAGGTWVMCHSNADTTIKGMSACNSPSLDFSPYVALELKYGSTTVDAFGEKSTMVVSFFNYLLFINDPIAYVASNKIGLNSLQAIDIRRGLLVKQGVSTFVSLNVFGKWSVAPGNDLTNLGKYKGTCNRSPEDLPIMGYIYAIKIIDEDYSLSNPIDDLDLTVDVPGTYLVNEAYVPPTNSTNVEVCFFSCTSFVNDYWNSSGPNPGANYLKTNNNLFIGQKKAYVQMTTVNSDFTPDPGGLLHLTYINGNKMAGIKENYLSTVKIAPSLTTDKITIKNTAYEGIYKVIDVNGKVVLNNSFSNNTTIDVSELANGMYFLIMQYQEDIATRKFIKQ